MKHLVNIITVLVWPVIGLSFIAANNETMNYLEIKNPSQDASFSDTLLYRFQDRSVPPQYHRSYTIRVTPEQVYFAIDVYGNVIAADSSVLTTVAYDSFVTALNNLYIKKKEVVIKESCTGGTSERLELYTGSNNEVKGYINYCGGKKDGDLEGDVTSAAILFKMLIPDLQKKIDATWKD